MIAVGQTVWWKWINGFAEGVVVDITPERTQIETKGKLITRNGTPDNPALIIEHANGTKILKLASEVKHS
jgi:hypothetical protein